MIWNCKITSICEISFICTLGCYFQERTLPLPASFYHCKTITLIFISLQPLLSSYFKYVVLWLFVDGKKVERKCAHKSKRWSVITEVGNPVYLFDRHCMLLTRLSPVDGLFFMCNFGQNIAVLKLRYNLSAYVHIILLTNW